MRNMVNAQPHEMGKGFVSRKKAGRGCGSRFHLKPTAKFMYRKNLTNSPYLKKSINRA
jgi:hypothetical protein